MLQKLGLLAAWSGLTAHIAVPSLLYVDGCIIRIKYEAVRPDLTAQNHAQLSIGQRDGPRRKLVI